MKLKDLLEQKKSDKNYPNRKLIIPASSRQIHVLGADSRIETWVHPVKNSSNLVGFQFYDKEIRIMTFERLVGKDSRLFPADVEIKDIPEMNHLVNYFFENENFLERA